MVKIISANSLSEAIVRLAKNNADLLDNNNFVWKVIDGEWVGKRSVWTFDNTACWLEETTPENVKSWWCGGIDADYKECFYREDKIK